MTALAFAGVIVMGVGGEIDAQVAGSTTVGVTVEELKVVALGWSAKKKILGKAGPCTTTGTRRSASSTT
jgi:hypothetical protein